MRRGAAWILMLVMLFSAAFAESTQKAPDFILEGFDGEGSTRNWETNLFFARMEEKTGISFQFREYTDAKKWQERKAEILKAENLPDVLFKAELNPEEVRDMYEAGVLTDLKPYSADGYLAPRPVKKEKILTTPQALNLLKLRGYVIRDDDLSITAS